MERFKSFIHTQYDLKWTDSPSLYLGIVINISSDGSRIGLNQSHYIESTLNCFSMANFNPVKSPLPHKTTVSAGGLEDFAAAIEFLYQSPVGSPGWIGSTTRPEIAYTVSQVGLFNSAWTLSHWPASKHVLRYLKGTQHLSIQYSGGLVFPLDYSDPDFSQCRTTRRSVNGFIVSLGHGLVSWRSERQSP